jgi:hypothetical protein
MRPWDWWVKRFRNGWAPDDQAATEAHVAALRAAAELGAIQERGKEVAEVADKLREARARNGFAESLTEAMTPTASTRRKKKGQG